MVKIKIQSRELRKTRLNVATTSSLYNDLKSISAHVGISTNDIVNQVLADFVAKEKKKIKNKKIDKQT